MIRVEANDQGKTLPSVEEIAGASGIRARTPRFGTLMTYAEFRKCLAEGESDVLDFKLKCDAFQGGSAESRAARAELAKDLCALANNGSRASRLIIGVSDNRRDFLPVANPKLTDDQLQNFCKTAISPAPRVRLSRVSWSDARPEHRGKEFVIIQVGPQPRQAFRLAQDQIVWEKQICYRRNEVWIRRGATSDLAAPEEIARLLKGEAPLAPDDPDTNTDYGSLLRDEWKPAVMADLKRWVEGVGGRLVGERIVVPLGRVRYVWRVVILGKATQAAIVRSYLQSRWRLEHGVLFLVQERVTDPAFQVAWKQRFKEPWGWLTWLEDARGVLRGPHYGSGPYLPAGLALPENTDPFSLPLITIPRVSSTAALERSLDQLLDFMKLKPETGERLRHARDTVNANLRKWARQGWLQDTGKQVLWKGSPPRPSTDGLGPGEQLLTAERGRPMVVRRDDRPQLMELIRTVQDLSAGRGGPLSEDDQAVRADN